MNEIDYHVVTVGHSGFFKASCARDAKKALVAHIQKNRFEQPKLTRSQRRYLFNRANAVRVSV